MESCWCVRVNMSCLRSRSLALEDLQEILSTHASAPYNAAAIGPADILEIVFTSGTTAEPKGVVITHGNVLGQHRAAGNRNPKISEV